MSPEDHFAEAHFPEPWQVLGVRLRPLSMGHLILLRRAGSPFIVQGQDITIGDLAFAVLVCSRTYAQGRAIWEDPQLPAAIRRWAKALTRPTNWWDRLMQTHKPIDLPAKITLFSAYLKEGTDCPGFMIPSDNDSKPIEHAPVWHIVKITLMGNTTLTEEQILDRPYRLCLADFLAIRAAEGRVEFVDHDQLEKSRQLANQLQERLNNRHAKQSQD